MESEAEVKMTIDLPILESTKDSQTQHGLKYENHRRYRSYCSRRLHRLRRSLNVHQGVASSAKARHQRGRKLMDINNTMVLEAGEKNPEYGERMLIIPLCLAERAWSYAMQLKQETSDHPRRRFHLIRRLKKASEHAQRFEKLCHDPESPCSARTKEEATAYASYITGLYKVERESWAEAKENLSRALAIYFRLCLSVTKDEVLEHYRQRIDELRASLRYCTFNLGDQEAGKKKVQVELPPVLQFHDLAFRHFRQLEQEVESAKTIQEAEKASEVAEVEEKLAEATVEDDEEDEFEETQENVADESEDESEEDEDDDDDDKNKKQQTTSRVGGVTGLVKGWLGGAWS